MKRPSRPRARRRPQTTDACPQVSRRWLVCLACSLLLACQAGGAAAGAAVVRPTIFLDPGQVSSTAASANSNSAAGALLGLGAHPAQPSAVVGAQASQQSSATQADGPQVPSAKIHPVRARLCTNQQGARIDTPLGLHSMQIKDSAISASSFSNEQVRPHLARLNLDLAGGAWCPGKPISSSNVGKEWIQVKLNRSYIVSAIETQGRFGMGGGKEFAPSYQIEYSRDSGKTFHKWKDIHGLSTLAANQDVSSAVRNELSPPIIGANVIRLLPHSSYLRTVCLRLEIHGCPHNEGAPIAYSSQDGVVDPRWGQLNDYTYDGFRLNGLLSQGLGQLVDGVKGPDNFSHNSGLEWVGWKSINGDVEIEFTFRHLRNFTGALFHSNNLFSSGVEVFQAVDVFYGIDVPLSTEPLREQLRARDYQSAAEETPHGYQWRQRFEASLEPEPEAAGRARTLWSQDVLSIEYEPDKRSEAARPVTVHLKQRLANRLRFVLKFASKWILVSEVEFMSQPVQELQWPETELEREQALSLVQALKPAKSYDEYLAVLREHQLRQIATQDYISFISSTQSSPSDFGLASEAGQASPEAGAKSPAPDAGWPAADPNSFQAPATSIAFNPLPVMNGALFPVSPAVFAGAESPLLQSSGENARWQPPSPGPATPSSNSGGLVSVIALALAASLLLAGLLFLFASYRMRMRRPQTELARHLASPSMPSHHCQMAEPAGGAWRNLWRALLRDARGPRSSGGSSSAAVAESQRHLYKSMLERRCQMEGTLKHHQLVVSVKEPSSSFLLPDKSASAHQTPGSGISTQLIVGLNPLNQQLYGQHLYAATTSAGTYGASMSLASGSSTTARTGAGDYASAEYAVPDAQPIISSGSHHLFGAPALGSKQVGSYLTEMRRPPAAHLLTDHNYELVQQQQQQQHTHRRLNPHMTLGHTMGRRQPPPPPLPMVAQAAGLEKCSPGAGSQSSSQSARTATTTANSSHLADLYYYTPTVAAQVAPDAAQGAAR